MTFGFGMGFPRASSAAGGPSLNLQFAGSTTLDPSITFTRASSGSYYDSTGILQLAGTNVPRLDYNPSTLQPQGLLIEESRTNLFTYSQQFDNVLWGKTNATVAADSVTAPDGTLTADKIVPSAVATFHFISQTGGTASATETQSVYAKAGGYDWLRLSIGTTLIVWFNVASGTIGTITGTVVPVIQPVGNGWYRCSISGVRDASTNNVLMPSPSDNVFSYTGNGTSGLYIWGAQLEAGAFATSYIPSTNTFTSRASTGTYYGSNGLIQTAAINVARYNYNPVNLTLQPTLLLEAAATNLLVRSANATVSPWGFDSSTGSGITLTGGLSPDGVTQFSVFNEGTSSGAHRVNQNITVVAGTTYTVSAYLKAGTSRYILIGTTSGGMAIDTETWTITQTVELASTTTTNPTLVNIGGGIYRASVSVAHTTNTTVFFIVSTSVSATPGTMTPIFVGTSRTAIFTFCGFEAGSGATSYIPTVASQVTRDADLSTSATATRAQDFASITTLTPWYNATEGTLMAVAIPYSPVTSTIKILAAFDDGTFAQSAQIVKASGTSFVNGVVTVGTAVYTGSVTTPWAIDTIGKAALAYKSSDNKIAFNGVLDLVATSTAGVPTVTKLAIGARYDGGTPWSGAISAITYYPRRLSDTELQSITA